MSFKFANKPSPSASPLIAPPPPPGGCAAWQLMFVSPGGLQQDQVPSMVWQYFRHPPVTTTPLPNGYVVWAQTFYEGIWYGAQGYHENGLLVQSALYTCRATAAARGVAVPPGITPPPSVGDVNPTCYANKYFVDDAMEGDYWTTYGSEDSEQRVYNANWVKNMLGLNGAHGVGRGIAGCGCKACERAQAAAQAPAQDAANQAVAAVNAANAAPCPEPPLVADVYVVAVKPEVAQTAPDTRWQQDDYPPTEGPTDADIRCAGCFWVDQVVPRRQQGVGQMEGIMRGGRPVQGFSVAPAAQPQAQSQGLAAPSPQGLGAANPSATSPATVGVVAALGGTVGLLIGATIGSEIGHSYDGGSVIERRAAAGGLIGMLVGSFTGAAIVAPSIQAQQGS
ncbi:MAG TPA: hypothetical protein VMI75_34505 [Polyangiaceae bacterium]|nr:hypothetical protein [Polyangiaceae bacterium]